ncbi:hypothetical protein BBJ28_00009312 [Nothophytophthora sp. Chile5]|nr:hypothetical protein BBJ28_00009312 [Nothophytophthora sp. Chile5]
MRSPSRHSDGKSPIRAKLPQRNGVQSEPVVSESRLLQAIRTLEGARSSKQHSHGQPDAQDEASAAWQSPLSNSLRKALCFLLEVAAQFDNPELANKPELETVCTARVLGCLQRFVASCASVGPQIGECCERKCEQRLVHLSLLSILFRMCREANIAPSVVKEGLQTFLIEMYGREASSHDMAHSPATEDLKVEPFAPRDLLLAIDPFDWCYQALCTRLLEEESHVFLAPLGIRSLTCLLRGMPLPTDEITEFQQSLRRSRRHCETSKKHRELPSIFSFPSDTDPIEGDATAMTKPRRNTLSSLCRRQSSIPNEQREFRAVWSVVLNDSAKKHLALRSLAALALHLPRPSPERRMLLLASSNLHRVFASYASSLGPQRDTDKSSSAAQLMAHESSKTKGSFASSQSWTLQPCVLKRMALTVSQLFAEDEQCDTPKVDSEQQRSIDGRNPRSALRAGPFPLPVARDCIKVGPKRGGFASQSLSRRLQAATENATAEIVKKESVQATQLQGSIQLEQSRRRHLIRDACNDIENLRSHLLKSLAVLYSGRPHPDPQQSFSAWIQSLPTIETRERERQAQQEMRQRQTLELQYQREATRRQERDECTQMQLNDHDTPQNSELSVQKEKRARFVNMQVEMRELEQSKSDGRNREYEAKLAIKERQRFLLLEGQKHEARERERMQREDLYYVERLLQMKQQQARLQKPEAQQATAIEEQRQRIARMRALDLEKQLAERESSGMRVEDLLGRQMRFWEAEKRKEELQNEWRARKAMQTEEHASRTCWTLLDRALIQQQQSELKQQRVEARRLKRQQRQEEEQVRLAWAESWDEQGNRYYYNSHTGLSQWEAPF